jgi:hypothetical protein
MARRSPKPEAHRPGGLGGAQGESMSKRTVGIAILALGGLIYAAALLMGVIGFPRPGWGHYKILLGLGGVAAACFGVFLLEKARRDGAGDAKKWDRYFVYGGVLNLALSIFPRLPFMDHISSWWRSSHTLLTTLWFQKEGISLFHYQTPVFGPPWEVPLEFPLYQAVCAVFSNVTGIEVTLSSRLVSLFIFYLSALFLMLLCLEFIESRPLCLIILTVYLWLPFNIRYSTEILPDYFSVVLALSYVYWVYRWLKSPRNYGLFFLAVLSGCLGAMVKITTMPIIMIPAVLVALEGMRGWGMDLKEFLSPKKALGLVRDHWTEFALLAVIVILPLLSAVLWVKFEDGVKLANPYTAWLTSASSSDWWYGTWAQKLSYAEWTGKFTNMYNFFLFGPIFLFPVLGILMLYKLPLKSRCVFGSALAGTLLTIFIFFHLYFHEYYYIAVAGFMSILIGFGIYALYTFFLPKNAWWNVFAGILFFFILIGGYEKFEFILDTVKKEVEYTDDVLVRMAGKIAAITPEDEYIITFQDDWWPEIMLFSQRKGLIIIPEVENAFTCQSVTQYPFTTIAVVNVPVSTAEDLGIFQCFGTVEEVEPGIYTVKP